MCEPPQKQSPFGGSNTQPLLVPFFSVQGWKPYRRNLAALTPKTSTRLQTITVSTRGVAFDGQRANAEHLRRRNLAAHTPTTPTRLQTFTLSRGESLSMGYAPTLIHLRRRNLAALTPTTPTRLHKIILSRGESLSMGNAPTLVHLRRRNSAADPKNIDSPAQNYPFTRGVALDGQCADGGRRAGASDRGASW